MPTGYWEPLQVWLATPTQREHRLQQNQDQKPSLLELAC